MKTGNVRIYLGVFLTALLCACAAEEKAPENTIAPPAADNTARNERDSTGATATPTDQGENETDLGITAKIRQAIVDDKALSSNAENVKIITNGGVVVLRGPVKSEQEKAAIEAKAKGIAGVTRVENQIEIAPPK
jgi:hyperosmotically inducible periplasmic protein